VSEKVDDKIAKILNTVSAALTAEDLVALNALSVNEQESADQIASDWLADKALF
jgi:osmoprotectant transport system substrate-binding protein